MDRSLLLQPRDLWESPCTQFIQECIPLFSPLPSLHAVQLLEVTSLQLTKGLLSTKWSGTARLATCVSLSERGKLGGGREPAPVLTTPSGPTQDRARLWVQRYSRCRGIAAAAGEPRSPPHSEPTGSCPNDQHADLKVASIRLLAPTSGPN